MKWDLLTKYVQTINIGQIELQKKPHFVDYQICKFKRMDLMHQQIDINDMQIEKVQRFELSHSFDV